MNKNSSAELSHDGVEQQSLQEFTENAYLNYSMYVIMDRALPFIGDGLKPVQRRIVYAMSELGLNATAKFKKSARTVGDVIGKYHPHGDSASYEAMVLMAQPFSYRYPLIEGQGNWGSPDDPKSFAAMRYTESRLSPYANSLLSELGQGTVEYMPNFDGTLDEPMTLPARLPNILLNGSTGIAVGMATDIPPHNVREVALATIRLLDHPDSDLESIMQDIQAPDYPTAAEIITPKEEIYKLYQTGRGTIRLRAVWQKEDHDIVITDLPHQVSGAKIIEQIAAQMRNKKLPWIDDIRDESDHEHPTRLVLIPRSNRIPMDEVMSHLCATTDLEKSYRVNLNMIGLNQKPETKGLITILNEWLIYRRQTVTRRLNYRLDKIVQRLHLLEGLLIAYLNLDEVIRIIRDEEEPKKELIHRFSLTEKQADAILDLKLRQLAKLEEMKIKAEQEKLEKEKEQLEAVLASPKKLNRLIKNEIETEVKLFGDARRSPLVDRQEAKVMVETAQISADPITVVLSEMGWIRAAKGHEIDPLSLNYKTGDRFKRQVQGKSNQPLVLLDSTGRSFVLDASALPSARGQGEPLSGKLTLLPNAHVEHLLMVNDENQSIILASNAGYGFICTLGDLLTRNKNGKQVIHLPEESQLLPPLWMTESQPWLLALTKQGRLLIFDADELPKLSKGKGNKIIGVSQKEDDALCELHLISETTVITLYEGKRKLIIKGHEFEKFRGERGRKGVLLPRGIQHIDHMDIS